MVGGVVLAGGAGRRMGGVDKATLEVGGVRLLDRVLAAAAAVCSRVVVVGPVRPTAVDGVTFVTEAQPGGGPAAAVAAGLDALRDCDVVLVLAADLPLLGAEHLRRRLATLDRPGAQASAAADRDGPNPLLAAYRAPALRSASAAVVAGDPAARLLPPATVVADLGPATLNVNRPEDLAEARRRLGPPPAQTTRWEPV